MIMYIIYIYFLFPWSNMADIFQEFFPCFYSYIFVKIPHGVCDYFKLKI